VPTCKKIMRGTSKVQSKQEILERVAAQMAKDPEVLKSVGESRAAFEQGRTLTSDQALPRKRLARA
jgi:hypothetical protein